MKDIKLNILVSSVNKLGSEALSIDICLLVNGNLVSGSLISYDEYLNSIHRITPEGPVTLGDFIFKHFKDSTDPSIDEVKIKDDYIHLRNVQILSGNMPIKLPTTLAIRISIEDICGFFFGNLSQEQS